MLTVTDDPETALKAASWFKDAVVSTWPFNEAFTYSVAELVAWFATWQRTQAVQELE